MAAWSDVDIRRGLNLRWIGIKPFCEKDVQSASYDLHLGSVFWRYRDLADIPARALDITKAVDGFMQRVTTDQFDQLEILPGQFLLGVTVEQVRLGSTVLARLEGKSSLGRLGIMVHSTAGFVDPGFGGYITLEMCNISPVPIILRAGMAIAQIAFQELRSPCEVPYGKKRGSRYTDAARSPQPTLSRIHRK